MFAKSLRAIAHLNFFYDLASVNHIILSLSDSIYHFYNPEPSGRKGYKNLKIEHPWYWWIGLGGNEPSCWQLTRMVNLNAASLLKKKLIELSLRCRQIWKRISFLTYYVIYSTIYIKICNTLKFYFFTEIYLIILFSFIHFYWTPELPNTGGMLSL